MNKKLAFMYSVMGLFSILILETKIISYTKKRIARLPLPVYKTEKFDFSGILKGFSSKQITAHEKLYKGYVDKRNEVTQKLDALDPSQANINYSVYRGLKSAETYVANGDVLHRLYFQNLGNKGSTMGDKTRRLLIQNYGSIDAYKQDLFATAKSARGWAVTYFTPDDERVHTFLLDSHNQKVPAFGIPLLVLDVYEHAYMIDFGIERVSYLDIFWNNINWDVVESRVAFVEQVSWHTYFAPQNNPS